MSTKTPPTRRKKHRNRPIGEDVVKRVRAHRALDLRAQGHPYREIGALLQVSEKTAYYDVQDELGRLDEVIKEKAERLRDLEARRLDQLTVALERGIRNGEASAVLACVRIMERRARLFGLDAPTQVTGPADGTLPVLRIVMQQDKG